MKKTAEKNSGLFLCEQAAHIHFFNNTVPARYFIGSG